ncbi:MAG TPA: SEC-C metal-binding domain-containing protein [Thermoanaerobaculia bacterium]|nr:SEC-C metal-binding domain-containing protein [Thermoanaerobaculia bacterium]
MPVWAIGPGNAYTPLNESARAHDAHLGTSTSTRHPDWGPRIGRNDPCPCGSGRKFKKCHGAAITLAPNSSTRADG